VVSDFSLAKTMQISRQHEVSSSNQRSNSSKNDKTTHFVPHNRPVSFGAYNVS